MRIVRVVMPADSKLVARPPRIHARDVHARGYVARTLVRDGVSSKIATMREGADRDRPGGLNIATMTHNSRAHPRRHRRDIMHARPGGCCAPERALIIVGLRRPRIAVPRERAYTHIRAATTHARTLAVSITVSLIKTTARMISLRPARKINASKYILSRGAR